MQHESISGSYDAGNDLPLRQGGGSLDLKIAARDQMSLEVEGIVDGSMSGEKSLRRAWTLEPDPTSFSASDRLMRILCAIVRSTTSDVAIG